jgi:hypothetical protein
MSHYPKDNGFFISIKMATILITDGKVKQEFSTQNQIEISFIKDKSIQSISIAPAKLIEYLTSLIEDGKRLTKTDPEKSVSYKLPYTPE